MTRGRARRYLLTKQGYYPGVVASMGYDVWDWSTLNAGTLFQDSAKTTPAVANADPVGCWVDGVKRTDATQVTTAVKPGLDLDSLNGLPTLAFDGGDLLATANISISTFAVWVVFQSGTGMIYEQSQLTNTNDGMFLYSTTLSNIGARRTTYISKTGTALNDNTWRVNRLEHNGTFSTFNYFNNNVQITTSGTGTNLGTATAVNPLYIGARSGVSLAMTGNIGQLLIMSPYPTDASILVNMSSYINNQWNGVY